MIRYSIRAALVAVAFAHPILAHEGHAAGDRAEISLVAASGESGDAAVEVTLGDLVISSAFARATLPNAPVGGGYVTITNNGSTDDRLVGAESPVAGDVQIHEMIMDGDMMKMRELADGLPVPAGGTVTLKPGGLHLMFMQLREPLVEGGSVSVTLTFEKAGTVTVELGIVASGAQGGAETQKH